MRTSTGRHCYKPAALLRICRCFVSTAALLLVACADGGTAPTGPCETFARACRSAAGCVGTEMCGPAGWGPCVAPEPAPERCDHLDNDCDGAADDIAAEPCGSDVGACFPGVTGCRAGALVCIGSRGPEPERCGDAADNDCDGDTDEPGPIDASGAPVGAKTPCYSGPAGTEDAGDCRSGYLWCDSGVVICRGEVLPADPDPDGPGDRDCDGTRDADDPGCAPVDVVALVDCSGSMATVMFALRSALVRLAGSLGSRYRLALVTQPGVLDRACTVETPLVAPADAVPWLWALNTTGAGWEPTWQCARGVADGELAVDWRPGSRRIAFAFQDEAGDAADGTTEADAAAALAAGGVRWVGFAPASVWDGYDSLADASGGHLHGLVGDADWLHARMWDALREIPCRPTVAP